MNFYVPICQNVFVKVNNLIIVPFIEKISSFAGVCDNCETVVPLVDVFEKVCHLEDLEVPDNEQSQKYQNNPETYSHFPLQKYENVCHENGQNVDTNAVEFDFEDENLLLFSFDEKQNRVNSKSHVHNCQLYDVSTVAWHLEHFFYDVDYDH